MARARRQVDSEAEDERQATSKVQAYQALALVLVFVLGVGGIILALVYRGRKSQARATVHKQAEARAARELGKELVLKLYGEAEAMVRAADSEPASTGTLASLLENESVIDAVVVRRKDFQDYYIASASGARPKFGLGTMDRRKDLDDGVWMVTNGAYSVKGRQRLVWLFCKGIYDARKPKIEIGRAMIFLEIPEAVKTRTKRR